MTYWAIMLITVLSGPMEGSQSYVLYTTEDECINSINAVGDTLSYDYKIECQGSDLPSGAIRPKARP